MFQYTDHRIYQRRRLKLGMASLSAVVSSGTGLLDAITVSLAHPPSFDGFLANGKNVQYTYSTLLTEQSQITSTGIIGRADGRARMGGTDSRMDGQTDERTRGRTDGGGRTDRRTNGPDI